MTLAEYQTANPGIASLSHSGCIILVEIDREIISTAILSLSLVHKGQLSVTGVKVCALGTV